jgi:pSer/pThr/pTyr-binding forkhead associated (FHA) protein
MRAMVRSLRIGHRRYVLSDGVNIVGREPSSTVCINDPSVSRGHARITIANGEATLEDLSSKNGTQVMGEALKAPRILKDGDELEFGHVKGWYIVEATDDPPTTTHL